MVVEKGNKIFNPANQLKTTEVRVEWAQDFTFHSVLYYAVPFYNRDQGDEESVIFIQKTYRDSLQDKSVPGDELTIIVDDSFQYGQNREKTKRWLVYHGKSNQAYQFRFMVGLIEKLGKDALKFGGGFIPSIDVQILRALFSDFLRNF